MKLWKKPLWFKSEVCNKKVEEKSVGRNWTVHKWSESFPSCTQQVLVLHLTSYSVIYTLRFFRWLYCVCVFLPLQLSTEVAQCKPISNIVDSMEIVACSFILDSVVRHQNTDVICVCVCVCVCVRVCVCVCVRLLRCTNSFHSCMYSTSCSPHVQYLVFQLET